MRSGATKQQDLRRLGQQDHGPLADDRDVMLLGVQRSALVLLWEMRRRAGQVSAGFEAWVEDVGVDLTILYGRVELGEHASFTVEEDTHFGTHPMGRRSTSRVRDGCTAQVTACRFPPMVPADETPEQCDKRRRKFGRERRKAMEQAQQADEPPAVIAGTVAERRLASLLAILRPSSNKAITLAEAARKIRQHEAWAGLSPGTVSIYVGKLVRTRPDLLASRPARDGHTKLQIWRVSKQTSARAADHVAQGLVPQQLPRLGDFQKLLGSRCPSPLLIGREDVAPPQEASGCRRAETLYRLPDPERLSKRIARKRTHATQLQDTGGRVQARQVEEAASNVVPFDSRERARQRRARWRAARRAAGLPTESPRTASGMLRPRGLGTRGGRRRRAGLQ
jgi:hypothetical protein